MQQGLVRVRAMRGMVMCGLLAVSVTVGACGGGGSKKSAEEPTDTVAEPATTPDGVDIPEEKYIEIKAFFDRKRRTVAHCFSTAMDKGEVDKNAKGRVMLKVKINMDGSLSNIEIGHSNLKSPTLDDCILTKARKWTVVSLPKALDYTYMFGFERL